MYGTHLCEKGPCVGDIPVFTQLSILKTDRSKAVGMLSKSHAMFPSDGSLADDFFPAVRKMGLIKYVMALMNGARLGIAAQSVGIAEAAYREALAYAQEREQFGKAILKFPAVYEMVATMKGPTVVRRSRPSSSLPSRVANACQNQRSGRKRR